MGPKILAPKNFSEKIFGPKEFYVQRNIGPRKIVGSVKTFGPRTLQKVFGSGWYTASLVSCFVRSLSPRLEQAEQLLVKKSMDEYAFIDIFQTSFTVSTI